MVRKQGARSVAHGVIVFALAVATSAWQETSKQQRRVELEGHDSAALQDERAIAERERQDERAKEERKRQEERAREERKRQEERAREDRKRQEERAREVRTRQDERGQAGEAAAPRARLPENLRATARAMADQQYRHRQRLARIERLRQVYRERGDLGRIARLEELRTKENARYARYLDERRRELGPERYAQVERALGAGAIGRPAPASAPAQGRPPRNGRSRDEGDGR